MMRGRELKVTTEFIGVRKSPVTIERRETVSVCIENHAGISLGQAQTRPGANIIGYRARTFASHLQPHRPAIRLRGG